MPLPGDLTTCTLAGTYVDSAGFPQQGTVSLVPSAVLADPTGSVVIPMATRTYQIGPGGTFTTDPLVATDCTTITPYGWTYSVVVTLAGQQPQAFSILLPHSPTPVDISGITPTVAQTAVTSYLATAGGTLTGTLTLDGSPPLRVPGGATSGDVLTSDADGNATWQASTGGSGGAPSGAASGDLGGSYPNPQVTATHLASPLPVNQGGTGAMTAGGALTSLGAASATALGAETTRAETAESANASAITAETSRAETAEALALAKAANLSDLASASTARTNLGLGSAATQAASAFDAAGAAATETTRAEAAEALLAPLASPALTGTPTAPTKTALTSSTAIATTAYADAAVATETSRAEAAESTLTGSASANATAIAAETSRAEAAEALLAPKASPALTGTPTAPTASALTSNTQVATTAYADSAVAVEVSRAETAEALKAPLASPALTGTPTAPTASALTASTQLATTAYADSAVSVETTRAEAAEALLAAKNDPLRIGVAINFFPGVTPAAASVIVNNEAWYSKLISGGYSFSNLVITVGAASGNVCVGAYTNSGSGMSAAPTGGRLATSGSVACPSIGIATISIGSAVTPNLGDWTGLAADNTTATFERASSGASAGYVNLPGWGLAQGSAFPLPSTPAGGVNAAGGNFIMRGA